MKNKLKIFLLRWELKNLDFDMMVYAIDYFDYDSDRNLIIDKIEKLENNENN